MNKIILFSIVFLSIFSISLSQKKVLFIGNSLTAGMPEIVADIAKSKGDSLYTLQIGGTPPLDTVDNYTREIINSEDWDYVVVQYNHQIEMLNEVVKQNSSCTQTVSYMLWGWENGNNSSLNYFEQQDQFRDIYVKSADEIEGICAPAGMSWKKVRTEKPWIDLYGGDNYHPNQLGMYLTACTFYTTFFEKSSEGATNVGLPDSVTTFFQQVATTIVLDSLETWNINVFAPNNTPDFINPIPNVTAESIEVLFEWENDESIISYELQISADKEFNELLLSKTDILESSFSFDFNIFNTLVFARLKGKYITQDLTECETSWRNLNIMIPFSGPELLTPENNISCSNRELTFNWKSIKNIKKYLIQFSLDSNFSEILADEVVYDNSYSHKFINLENNIFWRVQAYNGHISDKWSEVRHLELKNQGPNPLSPNNNSLNISNSNITLSWENTNPYSKQNYSLQVSKSILFDELVIDSVGLTTNEFEFSPEGYATIYHWRVLSDTSNCPTAWSDTYTFKTKLEPTILLFPPNYSKGNVIPITLEWQSQGNLARHQIVVSTDSTFNDKVYFVDDIQNSEIVLQELQPLTRYYWFVNTTIGEEICESSEIWYFTTSDIPPATTNLLLPADQSTGLDISVDFKWELVQDADSYVFEITENKGFTGTVEIHSDLDTNEVSLSNLKNKQLYYWRVKSVKNELESVWSEVSSFSTKDAVSSIFTEKYFSKIYPNPNTGRFNIESELKFNKMIIRDIKGVQVISIDLVTTNQYSLDLSAELSSGVYLIELCNGNSREDIRLVVE